MRSCDFFYPHKSNSVHCGLVLSSLIEQCAAAVFFILTNRTMCSWGLFILTDRTMCSYGLFYPYQLNNVQLRSFFYTHRSNNVQLRSFLSSQIEHCAAAVFFYPHQSNNV
jgi:hypothetical protein